MSCKYIKKKYQFQLQKYIILLLFLNKFVIRFLLDDNNEDIYINSYGNKFNELQ